MAHDGAGRHDDWDQWEDEFPPLGYTHHAQTIPPDARKMGLDRNTEEGALVAMASGLNPERRMHRLVAWVLLAVFCLPLVFTVIHEFF